MKLFRALLVIGIARTGSEAQRMIKDGSILVGGCIHPCNPHMCCGEDSILHEGKVCPLPICEQYKCTCGNWKRITNPTEEVNVGTVIRIKDGGYRYVKKIDGSGFETMLGIGRVPNID